MVLAYIAVALYTFNRFIMIPQFSNIVFFHEYLGDLLALSVYLPASLFVGIKLNIVPNHFEFRFSHIVVAVILFSVIFEGILPAIDSTSVRDPFDILAYFAGGLIVLIVSVTSGKSAEREPAGEHSDDADSSLVE